ncbi:MAG: AAA family ATPase [Steroidobacteraceae bacterium]
MPDDPPLIKALRAPDGYAHAVDAIEVRETHISWVMLTGQFAYKVKKPVRLAFLDFSTLESRRRYCEEELRLNRRFAPDLYLAVVPIAGTPDAPCVDGAGEPIEFAVQLRQFDPNEELAALVAHDQVQADALHGFGSRLAQIHASSAAHAMDSKVWATVQRNLHELQEVPAQLAQWLAAEHARLQPLLDRRGASGRIRECHGDLHAGNVVRWQGELVAFDCIEFNPDLRQIDAADDVAFLMMDLIARGRRDLAYAFADGWLETAGDYEAALVWRWFRMHRALVRTKVARLEGHDDRAARYLRTALAELAATAPRLIVMCGMSGSGKTWLSTQLLQALGAVRVRSDVERKRLAGLQAHESSRSSSGGGIYTLEFNDRVYAHLLSCARTVLLGKEHAIVDAASLRRHERASFIALARELGVELTIVHCHAPEAELRSRLQARRGDASEATVDVLERQMGYWEPFDAAERPFVLEVNTGDGDSVRSAIATFHA